MENTRSDEYYKHFNFRFVNGEITVQPRTNGGLAIMDYTDRLREGE